MIRRSTASFTIYSVIIFALTGLLVVLLARSGQSAPIDQLLVLGLLFAIAENRSVELPNRSSLSASLMIAMTAVVLFRTSAPLLGPLLVGLCGGLYLPHLRVRDWRKVIFNAANFGLSSLGAAVLFGAVTSSEAGPLYLLGASVPTALFYALLNSAFLVPAMMLLSGRTFSDVGQEMWVSDIQILPFGLLGLLLGELYLDLGLWVVPLFVTPIFIARQAFASYLAMRDAQDAALALLVRTLESKDRYTAGHVERVARFAVYMGEEFKFRPGRLERLRYAALMHDIGKLIVPNQILNKPGRLTAEEYERVRLHDAASVTLLGRIDFLAPVVPSLDLAHVPRGSDADVPLEARIIMVADAFDAMTSTRSYRRALEQDVAFAELRDKSGGQFDLACVEALAAALEQRGERYGSGHEEERVEFAAPPPAAGTGSAGLGDLAGESEAVGR